VRSFRDRAVEGALLLGGEHDLSRRDDLGSVAIDDGQLVANAGAQGVEARATLVGVVVELAARSDAFPVLRRALAVGRPALVQAGAVVPGEGSLRGAQAYLEARQRRPRRVVHGELERARAMEHEVERERSVGGHVDRERYEAGREDDDASRELRERAQRAATVRVGRLAVEEGRRVRAGEDVSPELDPRPCAGAGK
jgi:hypothetical protein